MDPGSTHVSPAPPTSPDVLRPREELVRVRAGAWQLLVPMRYVERVHGAALPAARPAAGDAVPPVVDLGGDLVPVVFAAALLGAEEVRLAPEQQMVLLGAAARRALLWVDAVEEVVEHAPVDGPAPSSTPGALVAGWSHDGRPLAVLDVPRVLELVSGAPERKECA
jgi:chemotaxis signal transduction protein